MNFEDYIEMTNNQVNESSLNRVLKAWMKYDTGTITAFRDSEDCGDGDTITKSEKRRRNGELKQILRGMGFGIAKVKGVWFEGDVEVSEESFFVVDINNKGNLKSKLIELGTHYEQDAITFAKASGYYFAISTNTCKNAWPGSGKIGVEVKLGSPKFGRSGINGFSKVNNRAFVFENYRLITKCGSLPEYRSMKATYEKYLNGEKL